ncbi:MAG TPA: cytochrome c peroxidase [Geminicoccaceae bacterium]|nr:cytochrome c peroxidase [Geminicoccaceae bacterium]
MHLPVRSWLAAAASLLLVLTAEGARGGPEPITALPAPPSLEPARVRLGERLFFDPRLSRDGSASCASCHDLDRGGDDGRARSIGRGDRLLNYNAPTVFNAALNPTLNWRGNFHGLEAHVEAVLLDPELIGASWPPLLARLEADGWYRVAFDAAYGRGPERALVIDAIASFERTLVTPGSRFDRFLAGDGGAITAEERRGYELFKAYGCVACHQGRNVGGNLFQRFGIFDRPMGSGAPMAAAELGRFAITGDERDRHVFRVPSLRNVAVTGPYFHDGRTASLAGAVTVMGRSQLGLALPETDIAGIVAFLGTLTGAYRGRPLTDDAPPVR